MKLPGYLWASIKNGLRPRAGYKHTAKKGSSKLVEKFLAGGALVGGAVATGEIISAVKGGNDPGQVDSKVYIRDSSSNLMKFSGIESGSLSSGSILVIAILAVIGFMVCIPITRCLRRYCKCGKKSKKETLVLPGSFHYRSPQQSVPRMMQTTQAIGESPQDVPEMFPAPPVFPHQVKPSVVHFPSPASAPTAWDQEDISEDPIVTGVCSGFYGEEIQSAPPAMEDVMANMEKREVETLDTEDEEEFRHLGKRNNLGERLRIIKKRALERVSKE